MSVYREASPSTSDEPLFSVGHVAAQTGISPDTLRVWERRYGEPRPLRLESGHRRYTADQVRRLRRVAEGIASGMRPKRLLTADEAELDRLVGPDREPIDEPAVRRRLELVRDFREAELRADLEPLLAVDAGVAGARTVADHLDARIGPLLEAVGQRWAGGDLEVRHEHFVVEVLGDLLRARRLALPEPGPGAPLWLLATLTGEPHELGLQMAALVLAAAGARVRILGTETPIVEIVHAAAETGADAVGISVSLASGGVSTDRILADLRGRLPADVALLVGGAGARRPRRALRGVTPLAGLIELVDHATRAA